MFAIRLVPGSDGGSRPKAVLPPNRQVRASAVEMHEDWLGATRYLNIDHLREHKKEACEPWPPEVAEARGGVKLTWGSVPHHAQHHQRRLNC